MSARAEPGRPPRRFVPLGVAVLLVGLPGGGGEWPPVVPPAAAEEPSPDERDASESTPSLDERDASASTPSPEAEATAEDGSEPPLLDLAFGTHFPLSLGGEATVEVPGRLLFQGHVGWLPAGYVRSVNEIGTSAGFYDAETATLVEAGLGHSLVIRGSVGWRPFPGAGFELLAGYTLGAFGGAVSARRVIEATTDREVPDRDIQLSMDSTMHAIHVGAGWRWLVGERVTIRAMAGYLHSVGSSGRIDPKQANERTRQAAEEAEGALREALREDVRLPIVRVVLGFRI